MNSTLRVVICGQSIFLMAIEVALTNRPELEAIRLRCCPPEATENIIALNPHLVVVEQNNGYNELILTLLRRGLALVEQNNGCNELILTLLRRGLALVELNEKGQGIFLSRRDVPVFGPADLVRLIEPAFESIT